MNDCSEDVLIRRMSAADVRRVMGIAASLKDAPHWPESAYLAAVDAKNVPPRIALVGVNRSDDRVVGFAIASVVSPEAELETIAVCGQEQRRGIGRLLVQRLIEELVAIPMNRLVLEVRSSNRPARRLYESEAFSESGRRSRYYADPKEDAILLELKLR